MKKQTDTRATGLYALAGMACLWPSLQVSPYYPFSLSPVFLASDPAAVSVEHAFYAFAAMAFFALVAVFSPRLVDHLAGTGVLVGAGAAGVAGSACVMVAPFAGAAQGAVGGAGLVLVAFYVAIALCAWLGVLLPSLKRRGPLALAGSFAAFYAVWLLLQAVVPDAGALILACMPALATACAVRVRIGMVPVACTDGDARPVSLPVPLLALSCACVYFAVIAVRVFTTMGMRNVLVGNLSNGESLVTFAASLAVGAAVAVFVWRRPRQEERNVAIASGLALLMIAALLVMLLAEPGQVMGQTGRRVLVAAEHGFTLLIALVLLDCSGSAPAIALRRAALFGIVVVILPHTVSLDFMMTTGLLRGYASVDLTMPLAAASAFAIAAGSMGLLVWFSARALRVSAEKGEEWRSRLCAKVAQRYGLSQREAQVLERTYCGHSAKTIAGELLVSESTVKAHLSHVYRKMGIHSKQELIALVDSFK